jgi:phospholipase/carboxylesterase
LKAVSKFEVGSSKLIAFVASVLAAVLLSEACVYGIAEQGPKGRITAKPRAGVKTTASGTTTLGLDTGRDAILRMPANPSAAPVPLLVWLHGAGGSGAGVLRRLGTLPDELGIAVLAPDSRSTTWDAIRGGFGADVAFINRALERVFETVSVDPKRIAVGGFSDGATYAISLGLINGDLFRRVAAFSPGFVVEGEPNGKPSFYVSHGRSDDILPISRCSRVIVPGLEQRGYTVLYREFDGVHDMPAQIAKEGLTWLVK